MKIFAPYRNPLSLVDWYTRRRLGIAGLRQRLLSHTTGQLSYFYRRPEHPRSQETVVLVHGLGGHGGDWFQTVKCLRDRDLVIVELPGHGDSQLEGLDWGTETIFEIFTHLVDEATDEEPIILVGNSMGGWLSIHYALAFPDRVEKLVLVNSAGLRFDVDRRFLLPETREEAQGVVDGVFGHDAPRLPGFILDALIRRARTSPTAVAIEHAAHARYIDERLSNLRVPTEIIWGVEDPMLPIEHAYRLEEDIPDSRLHLLPGAGHSPQVGAPKAFNEVLVRVLE